MTTCFKPGQLLRVTSRFSAYIPATAVLYDFRVGDIFLLLSVENQNPQNEWIPTYKTTMLINSSEVAISEWWLEPFEEYEALCVEPVEVT